MLVPYCDRCLQQINGEAKHVQAPGLSKDICHKCLSKLARFFRGDLIEAEAAPPAVKPKQARSHCAMGTAALGTCCKCGKEICNLCGFYSDYQGRHYCAEHKPATDYLQAR